MVTLLITTLAIFAVIGIGVYLWQQQSAPSHSENLLPPLPPTDSRGLFINEASEAPAELEIAARELADALISRAQNGERSALADAHESGDTDLYYRVLAELLKRADSDPNLLALASYVAQKQFPVSAGLAEAMLISWKRSPDRSSTAKALHFAALSDDPDVYRVVVEDALSFWRAERLKDISPLELQALFNGEFWVLSSRSRSSGAGFVLKRTLAGARRELEAASANK
jgi:hypothetical protein